MKKFFKTTSVLALEGDTGFQVLLDQRVLKSAAKRDLALPTLELAEAMAAEWAAQDEDIAPQTMPMTGYAFTAVDVVADKDVAVREEIAKYAETDLLCYITEEPKELNARLTTVWLPMLDWSAKALDAPLVTTAGLMAVAQPPESIAAFARRVHSLDLWALTSVQILTSVLGSLVLAMAVVEGRLTIKEAFDLSRLEEEFQDEQWGVDEEAAQKRANDAAEVANAARFLQISRILG